MFVFYKPKQVIILPELPEMETYRTLLEKITLNQKITEVIVSREKSINVPPLLFQNTLKENVITSIGRRGKHLIFNLESGHVLLLHLMLGGWLYYGTKNDAPNRTKQIEISFGEKKLYFIGLRLGYLHLLSEKECYQRLTKIGAEPLDKEFNIDYFRKIFSNRKAVLKSFLTNQAWIGGIGNCYADEICFNASVLPFKKINELDDLEKNRLFESIKSVLQTAINLGGYMENKLFVGDLLTGGYNDHCFVYDRGGEPCLRCSGVISQSHLSSRKVFFCPICQH